MGRGFGPGVGVPGPSMSDGSGGVGVGSMVTGCPKLARLAEDEDDGEGDLKRTFFSVPGIVQSRVEEGLHVTSERRLLGMPETEDNGESLFTLLQQRVCAQHASGQASFVRGSRFIAACAPAGLISGLGVRRGRG